MVRRLTLLATFVVAVIGLMPTLAAGQATPVGGKGTSDPGVGSAIAYISAEGTTLGELTVASVVDPFTAYDPSSPPQRGNRFVLLRLTAQNTSSRTWHFDPDDVVLQDDAGFLYQATSIERSAATPAAESDLAATDLAPGSQTSGVIGYSVLATAHMVRVFYQPASDRLILLAHLP